MIHRATSNNVGEVFGHDWYATPLITMTCQDSGDFDAPDDWTDYFCQLRKIFRKH